MWSCHTRAAAKPVNQRIPLEHPTSAGMKLSSFLKSALLPRSAMISTSGELAEFRMHSYVDTELRSWHESECLRIQSRRDGGRSQNTPCREVPVLAIRSSQSYVNIVARCRALKQT